MPSMLRRTRGGSLRDSGEALAVEGLVPLMRALKRAEGDAAKELRKAIRAAVKPVHDAAKAKAPVGPRPKRSKTKPLKQSVRMSTTQTGASIYSMEEHAYVQDRGGQVGRNRSTLLPRARASGYMTRAVRENRAATSKRLEGVLDSLADDFEQ